MTNRSTKVKVHLILKKTTQTERYDIDEEKLDYIKLIFIVIYITIGSVTTYANLQKSSPHIYIQCTSHRDI